MELKNSIGKVIKSARKEKEITQYELAERVGISRTYLSDIECGRYIPSVNKLVRISIFLDLDLNLFKNDGNTSV
ncbi:helix-turn-helix transcriptional regulator [uncultured Clostridium sp.]|jgi:transcriptional regulator with XRE-family HTH domain|uniref:helix-turn-helix domain-containing protein n=1 Tax=uncultured Clostridium sp. TaxID=59620 RepID=UPI00261372A1|nr:helix-turn-helix transcriptional regulator [uncultured Clostridium sp.]